MTLDVVGVPQNESEAQDIAQALAHAPKHHGVDRTNNTRRKWLGLEPKRKDWRLAAMDSMPKRMTKHFEQGRELVKAAKGLR
jgi:hypothetical protein